MAEKILFQKDKYIVGITEEGNLYETYVYTNSKKILGAAAVYKKEEQAERERRKKKKKTEERMMYDCT